MKSAVNARWGRGYLGSEAARDKARDKKTTRTLNRLRDATNIALREVSKQGKVSNFQLHVIKVGALSVT
jgi:hypothetical protein